jgi:ABC-type transport system involved in multi-copper enzyme maturation permease subunit
MTIIKNTFREALAKKIFIGYYIFYAIVVLLMLFAVNLDAVEGIVSFADVKGIVISVETGFLSLSFSLILFFSLISTSSFIPSMLEKGTIDLLISKPISRFSILISKFLGAVLFVAISMVFLIGSIWLILSLKSGYWSPAFLYSILSLTAAFAVMYSITILIGLLTNSSVISILANFFLIFVLCPVLSVRESVIFPLVKNESVQFVFNFLYYIFPKPGEIKDVTNALISGDNVAFWKGAVSTNELGMNIIEPTWMAVITSLLFCAVIMSYSVYYFSKKDY